MQFKFLKILFVCLFVFGRIYKKFTELCLKGVGNQSRIGYWLFKSWVKKVIGVAPLGSDLTPYWLNIFEGM